MSIQWYPGHMAKASRQMQEYLKLVDFVIEVRDARIPLSSANPQIAQLVAGKPRLILLNKEDKADPIVTQAWITALTGQDCRVLASNATRRSICAQIQKNALALTKEKRDRQLRRGIQPTAMKAMVVGIPNAGKSTLINTLAGKKTAMSADHPGVTKKITWLKASNDLALLDTPGVLWPKIDDETVGYRLAVTGAIRDEILPIHDVVLFALEYLTQNYPQLLMNRYDIELDQNPLVELDRISVARGMMQKGGVADTQRCENMLIKEIRDEKIGRISWEKPQK